MISLMIRSVPLRQIRHLFIFGFCALLSLKLMDFSMLRGQFDFINNHVAIFIVGIAIAFFKKARSYRVNSIFFFMLVMMIVSTFARKESEFYLTNTLGIFGIAFFYNMDKEEYRCSVYGIFVGAIPFLFSWLKSFLMYREYLGNRGPLCFSVVGFLLITVLLERKRSYAFAVAIFNMILCLVGSSRTSMLCNIGCVFLIALDMWRGKLTFKKIVTIFLSVIVAMVGFSLAQDAIVELLSSKWKSSQGSISLLSNRELMWIAVLSDIKTWGYPSNFLQDQFSLGNIHNAYIQSYVSFGVIVGVLYVSWAVMILVKGIKNKNSRNGVALLIPMIAITVVSMFESTFILEAGYPLLGICVVLLSGQIDRLSPIPQKKGRKGIMHV